MSVNRQGMAKIINNVFMIILIAENVNGANILFVAPFPALSHYQMLEPLMLNLAKRGHQVTVLSHFPRSEKVINLRDVDLRGIFPPYELEFSSWSLIDDMFDLFDYGHRHCEIFAKSAKLQNFLKAHEKFDLIFTEAFDSDCYLGLVAKHKAPYILFSAMALPVWESDWIYNPTEPAYLPDHLCRLAGKMNFYDKLQNVACHVFFRWLNWFRNVRPSAQSVKQYFNVDFDTLESVKRNVSLIFTNSFHTITGVRPLLPNVVEIGGIHIRPPKPLPEGIQKFLNESQDGAIIISMGSIVKSQTLDPKVRKDFLAVVSKLKERVIWKWEAVMPDKPCNLMTASWLPQSDVLGHPKVKLFISHGGIHGLYEAVHHGVPVVGIPLFGDQIANLKALEMHGAAVLLDFKSLNEKTLSSAITQVLSNKSYKHNAEKLSRIFRDQPQTPLEKAIFWTEYVIRHGGAQHFRSGALQLSWLQYTLSDVLLVCFSFCILLIVVFHYSLKFLRII